MVKIITLLLKKFKKLEKNKFFIETAINFKNYYGSPLLNITSKNSNKLILFDIDWKGARKIRNKYDKKIIDFFILPPSKLELKKRLIKRGRDNIKDINLRLSYAITEMKHYKEYKYVLVNENIQQTVEHIKKIIETDLFFKKRKKLKNHKI